MRSEMGKRRPLRCLALDLCRSSLRGVGGHADRSRTCAKRSGLRCRRCQSSVFRSSDTTSGRVQEGRNGEPTCCAMRTLHGLRGSAASFRAEREPPAPISSVVRAAAAAASAEGQAEEAALAVAALAVARALRLFGFGKDDGRRARTRVARVARAGGRGLCEDLYLVVRVLVQRWTRLRRCERVGGVFGNCGGGGRNARRRRRARAGLGPGPRGRVKCSLERHGLALVRGCGASRLRRRRGRRADEERRRLPGWRRSGHGQGGALCAVLRWAGHPRRRRREVGRRSDSARTASSNDASKSDSAASPAGLRGL